MNHSVLVTLFTSLKPHFTKHGDRLTQRLRTRPFLGPPYSSMESLKVAGTFKLEHQDDNKRSVADLVIEGFGWISFTGKFPSTTFKYWTIKGKEKMVWKREPALIPNGYEGHMETYYGNSKKF